VPLLKGDLSLQLQNLPGENGMLEIVPRKIFLPQFYINGYIQSTIRELLNANEAAAK